MRKFLVLVLAISISLSFTALAQPTSDVPVTSRITDFVYVDDGTRIDMQVQSDGAGVYNNSKSVESVIQGIGDWELDTGVYIKSPTRKAYLDFSQPIAGSGPGPYGAPTPPFVTGLVRPRFLSQTSRYNLNMFTIPYLESVNAPLNIGFNYPIGGSDKYLIHMTDDSNAIFPYPEIDHVNITCTGQDANLCNRWQITPDGEKGCAVKDCSSVKWNVVKLVKVVTVRGQTTEVNLGNFYMTFAIDITEP
jgi:hypothetical protein